MRAEERSALAELVGGNVDGGDEAEALPFALASASSAPSIPAAGRSGATQEGVAALLELHQPGELSSAAQHALLGLPAMSTRTLARTAAKALPLCAEGAAVPTGIAKGQILTEFSRAA